MIRQYFNVYITNKQMQFVLNPNPLIFTGGNKKTDGIQYYEWRYKQKILQQQQNRKYAEKLLQAIERQQQQERKQNINKRRIHYKGTFYDYNLKWKKEVDNRIQHQKSIKQQQIAKIQQSFKKLDPKEEKKQTSFAYKGPIQGWQAHFQNYLKNKTYGSTITPRQATFQPKINQKSRKMAEGMVGKVQDRLLMYGQFLKMKIKQNQIDIKNSQTTNFSFSNAKNQKYFSNASQQSQFFYRLYKQGQQSIKKRKQLIEGERHSFQPKINKLSSQVEDKIMKRRKPLYYIKNKDINQNISLQNIKQDDKKMPKGNFEQFMKRNQALIDMKKKLLITKRQNIEEQENLQKSKCTFSPVLNNKSIKINKTVKQSNKQFEQKLLKQIKSQIAKGLNQPIENIDISKLTIPQGKDMSQYQDQDSLSAYKMQSKEYKTKTQIKSKSYETNKQPQSQRQSGNQQQGNKNTKRTQQKSEEVVLASVQIVSVNVQMTSVNVQQDSIQKMKNNQWEAQLQQIESHLQNMMARATK